MENSSKTKIKFTPGHADCLYKKIETVTSREVQSVLKVAFELNISTIFNLHFRRVSFGIYSLKWDSVFYLSPSPLSPMLLPLFLCLLNVITVPFQCEELLKDFLFPMPFITRKCSHFSLLSIFIRRLKWNTLLVFAIFLSFFFCSIFTRFSNILSLFSAVSE